MRIRLTRRPGQPGTLHEQATYGDKLVCVRYRYDEATHKRHKTVEIITETIDWHVPEPAPAPEPIPPETPVYVRVIWGEISLARAIRRVRGFWDGRRQLWRLRYDDALALGLEDRIDWGVTQQMQM
jgi:hypothetical protein